MARRITLLAAAGVLAISGFVGALPAHAGNETFTAPVPGTVLTPYWLDTVSCIGCNPNGNVRNTLRQVGYDKPVLNGREYIEVCDKPTPPGASDFRDPGLPQGGGLAFSLFPPVDWDGFICGLRGPNADELRSDPTDTAVRYRVEAQIANDATSPCPNQLGIDAIPVGCIETGSIGTQGGVSYRVLAYNWSDGPNTQGEWHWF